MTGPPDAPGAPDPALLARLLRQRLEMGSGPLFLGDVDRETLLRAAAALARGEVAAPSADNAAGGPPREAASAAPPAGAAGLDLLREALRPPTGAASPEPERGREDAAGEDVPAPTPALRAALEGGYEELRTVALGCTRCGLSEGRTQVVFSDGVVDARVVVIGEAPGANEDRTGLPFVGAAGKLLDLMLAAVDLSRERDVYICNVLKCRPPGNRNPLPVEIETCAPFLRRQVELVAPEVVLGVGTFAAQWLTGSTQPLGRIRGSVHSYEGVPAVVTYHPAALLRNPGWTRAAWHDLQLLRQVLDGS